MEERGIFQAATSSLPSSLRNTPHRPILLIHRSLSPPRHPLNIFRDSLFHREENFAWFPRDDFGWEAPVNLGCVAGGYLNSKKADLIPALFDDEMGK
jgi:hypothetical protein